MFVYYLLTFIVLIEVGTKYFHFNKSKIIFKSTYFILSLFAILKSWCVGGDVIQYNKIYIDIFNGLNLSEATNNYSLEPLYYLSNYLFTKITNNFNYFMLTINLFNTFCVYRFLIKFKLEKYLTTLPIYLIFIYFTQNYFYVRQGIALSIIALGFTFFNSRKFVSITILACAPLIHSPAILVYLCFLKFERIIKTKISFIIMTIILIPCYLYSETIMITILKNLHLPTKDYIGYINLKMYPPRSFLIEISIAMFCIFSYYLYFNNAIKSKSSYQQQIDLILVRGLLLFGLVPMAFTFNADLARRSQFYFILSLFIIGKIFTLLKNNNTKYFYIILSAAFIISGFIVRFSNETWVALMDPYIFMYSCDSLCNELESERRLLLANIFNILN